MEAHNTLEPPVARFRMGVSVFPGVESGSILGQPLAHYVDVAWFPGSAPISLAAHRTRLETGCTSADPHDGSITRIRVRGRLLARTQEGISLAVAPPFLHLFAYAGEAIPLGRGCS